MNQYQQLINKIKKDISNKVYLPGDKLPSLNQLSSQYQVSRGTVIKAYQVLEKECLIYAKPKSGYYLSDSLHHDTNLETGYHLETGNPTVNHHLFHEMKQCLNIAAELYSFKNLDVTVRGVDSLNELLPEYLAQDAIYVKRDNIYLIQGIMQMLTIFTNSPFPNGKKTILIEEPSYSFYIKYLKLVKAPVKTIKRDANGIDLKQLEQIFKYDDIKFFYTISRHHNPLGTYYNHHIRKSIMELAIKYDVYIIEDDYFNHYHRLSKYVPMYYFSNRSHCIYLRSYTKTIPFIRIGIAVIPDDFITTMDQITDLSYYYSYHMPSLVSQATLEAYIRSDLDKYQSKIIDQDIKAKWKVVKKISQSWNQEIVCLIGGYSGYYCMLQLNEAINVKKVIAVLKKQEIYLSDASSCYYNDYHHCLRLSISRIKITDLKKVLKQIYEVIQTIFKQ